MTFEIIELITSGLALIAFFIFLIKVTEIKETKAKKLRNVFLLIMIFILFNRFFTIIEGFFLRDLFNILEHSTKTIVAVLFLHATNLGMERGKKNGY